MEGFDPTQPSKGLGDTIAKVTHYTGISKLTDVITDALGIEDCGCNRRREELNNAVNYNLSSDLEPAETGLYEVLKQIKVFKDGATFELTPGDRIWLTENNILYSEWSNYILMEAVKKIK
jgi:hypothetical protein